MRYITVEGLSFQYDAGPFWTIFTIIWILEFVTLTTGKNRLPSQLIRLP